MTAADQLFQCADCGLHYTDPQKADECYRHCTKYRSCNLEITKHSVERGRSGFRADSQESN